MVALAEILERHPVWRGGSLAQAMAALPSGFSALDAELPGGGWPRRVLTEVLAGEPGIGELQVILPSLAALTRSGRRTVWIAPPYIPYPPALAAASVDLANVLIVRSADRRDALWAAEQALRSGSCHALAGWLANPRYAELQRLAVAAEASHAAAFLFRPLAAANESSPAALRILLEPATVPVHLPELHVRIVKRRGAPLARAVRLDLDRPFHVVGRAALPRATGGDARADRRLGLPVHA